MKQLQQIAETYFRDKIRRLMIWCITAGLTILLFPPHLFSQTGFQPWRDANTPYIVLVMLIAVAYLLSPLLMQCWDTLEYRIGQSLSAVRLRRLVKYLDANERAVLREFILQRKTALQLPVDDPAVSNLLRNGFLQPSAPMSIISTRTQEQLLHVALAARPYLTRKVLNLPARKLTDNEVEWLRNSRPKFASHKSTVAL